MSLALLRNYKWKGNEKWSMVMDGERRDKVADGRTWPLGRNISFVVIFVRPEA